MQNLREILKIIINLILNDENEVDFFLVLGFLYSYRERDRMLIFFEILKVVNLRLEFVVKEIKLGK